MVNDLEKVFYIMSQCTRFKDMRLSGIQRLILPPMRLGQYRIYSDKEVPMGYASWALLSNELSEGYKKIGMEMYEMFARKHMDYGLNNIALGGNITNPEDKKFSLTGLCIRLTDKISRLKNLLINGKNYVKGEGMEDTFIDIANYGIIGLLVGRDKWKK